MSRKKGKDRRSWSPVDPPDEPEEEYEPLPPLPPYSTKEKPGD